MLSRKNTNRFLSGDKIKTGNVIVLGNIGRLGSWFSVANLSRLKNIVDIKRRYTYDDNINFSI